MHDSELVARALAGEREAFHELLERHSAALLATLVATLGNREDAREVFQDTWLRAHQHLGRLREPARVRAWLVTIALNLAHARRRRPAARELDPEAPGVPELPGADLERDEELAALRRQMDALPARQRQVLDLRIHHELDHAEIAAQLGITEEASRASFYQGLKRLKGALARPGRKVR
ncbi:MAG TPA: sigma-70 family RNA polymerase sigma factor [Planctomycetota bacterium]